jgi:hypothetical protein
MKVNGEMPLTNLLIRPVVPSTCDSQQRHQVSHSLKFKVAVRLKATHSNRLSGPLDDPLLSLCPCSIELEEASFTTTLDELVAVLSQE